MTELKTGILSEETVESIESGLAGLVKLEREIMTAALANDDLYYDHTVSQLFGWRGTHLPH